MQNSFLQYDVPPINTHTQHNTHTKDEESKTKTNQPANKPFIQKFSWNEAPFLEKTICSNMYHDFSSKQSVNSTSFYLHFLYAVIWKEENNVEVCFRFFLSYSHTNEVVWMYVPCWNVIKRWKVRLAYYIFTFQFQKGFRKCFATFFWGIYFLCI